MNEPEHEKLTQGLRDLARHQIFVPPAVDEKIRRAAQSHFAHQRNPARPPFRYKWLSLAASIAVAGIVLFFALPRGSVSEDLNGDGIVDIIDALLLGEQVRDGKGIDLNGDGLRDARDAAFIAHRAVLLGRDGS